MCVKDTLSKSNAIQRYVLPSYVFRGNPEEAAPKIDEITILDPDDRYLNDFIMDMQHRALLEVGDKSRIY